MERCRKMDAAGRASNRRALIRIAIVLCLVISDGSSVLGQSGQDGAQNITPAEQLVAERRWQDVVNLVQSVPATSVELYFDYGTALAQLGRWEDARRAFRAGARLRPDDKRFPIELAGVAFKQKR